uniref:G-protein coupled receptors family 2 profile 2 domain-containing protein n=1 Tax=Amphora coffeiformis TaxID=265554 RepID=A0A7S3P6F5_9STRA|mmetsp:Transcript_5274/g.10412  ORF Transcript_5274/g.10412 Transcript_5274/m.10412 type:complete len:838 (+) Transcript_5274:121-2634(+)
MMGPGMRIFWVALWAAVSVRGQRDKRGCYDAAQLSCQNKFPTASLTVNVSDVCEYLALEVFPTQAVMIDASQHPEYLNGIEAESELCDQIQQAYSYCFFCHETAQDFIDECFNNAVWTQCGEKPTLKEVLVDNTDPIYALYKTEEDILADCEKLTESYQNRIWIEWGVSTPSTQDLCMRQSAIKHLCPGYCEGGCFDGPNGTPPSCDPYEGPRIEGIDELEACRNIDYNILFWIALTDGPEAVLDISRHAGYLKNIPGNTTVCQVYQQSYPSCYWCDKELCFDEASPATCDTPTDPIDPNIDVDQICNTIYTALYNLDPGSPDFFNVSLHTDLLLFGKNTPLCDQAKQVYHQCHWCHQTEYEQDFCEPGTWCTSTATLPENFALPPEYQIYNLSSPENEESNCSAIFDHWKSTYVQPVTLGGCYGDIWLHRHQCLEEFCQIAPKTIDKNYLGATTDGQKKALVWVSRVAALMSFAGASYILFDILSLSKKRQNVYYQLLITVAIFDIVTAVAWCFSTAPIDKDLADHVYGAMGNQATCKAQAFFVQLGFTSVFCNVSLAIYYVLTIARGWKEFQLKAIRWYLQGFPLVSGIGLACGAITNYHWIEYGCHILPLEEGDTEWPILVFAVIPLGLSIISITMSMWFVYRAVQVQATKAKKWRLGGDSGGKNSLEREVFWQCLLYVLAFYITWPIMFSVYLASVDIEGPLGLTLLIAFLAPLQGFWNSLVYLRPKIKLWLAASNKKSRKPSTPPISSTAFNKKPRSMLSTTASSKHSMNGTESTAPTMSTAQSTPDFQYDHDMDPSALLPQRNEQVEQPLAASGAAKSAETDEAPEAVESK